MRWRASRLPIGAHEPRNATHSDAAGSRREIIARPGGHAPVGRGDGTDRGLQYGGRRTSIGPRPRSPARVCAFSRSCDTGVENANDYFRSRSGRDAVGTVRSSEAYDSTATMR